MCRHRDAPLQGARANSHGSASSNGQSWHASEVEGGGGRAEAKDDNEEEKGEGYICFFASTCKAGGLMCRAT